MFSFKYSIYFCTVEQTKRLFKLGMALEAFDPDFDNGVIVDDSNKIYAIPTFNKAIKFLCKKYSFINIKQEFHEDKERFSLYNNENCFYQSDWDDSRVAEINALNALLYFIEK